MRIELVVAMAQNRVIGRDNGLPWHLPEDLRHFRALTMGRPILMGRRTWESIGRPLPGRTSIVLSARGVSGLPAEVRQATDLEDALAQARAASPDPQAPVCMVIGGAEIYRLALPLAQCLHLTLIRRDFAGDTWFPPLDESDWCEIARREGEDSDRNGRPPYAFLTLERCA
jgi:dihydrofolate reductase